MRKHHLARALVLVAVLATAAVLVPDPAPAHAHVPHYRLPQEYATAFMGTTHPLPRLNLGTVAAVVADRDLERFGMAA